MLTIACRVLWIATFSGLVQTHSVTNPPITPFGDYKGSIPNRFYLPDTIDPQIHYVLLHPNATRLVIHYDHGGCSSVGRALDSWSKDMGSIPAGARSMLVRSTSVKCDRLRQKSWSPRSVSVWQHVKLSDFSLGAHPSAR